MTDETVSPEVAVDPEARIRALGIWMAKELTVALRARAQTQQQMMLALERAQLPGGPLSDPLGRVFAAELRVSLDPDARPASPTPDAPTGYGRKRIVL